MSRLSEPDSDGWRSIFAPAKVNLLLSIHGKRDDGFHDLSSIVAPLGFGDTLKLRLFSGDRSKLVCQDKEVPTDETNLTLRAWRLFSEETGLRDAFEFCLDKRIPIGAGLGGGSSDGTSALVALNEWYGKPLAESKLMAIAAEIGSDCALFVDPKPCLMEGRGEVICPLSDDVVRLISGQRILLFMPPFSIHTGWAYQHLAKKRCYEPQVLSRERIHHFGRTGDFRELLFNNFEQAVGEKYLAIPSVLERIRNQGANCLMSGSGSCCFILLDEESHVSALSKLCQNAFGEGIFCVETFLL